MKIWIDTEFNEFRGELISLALVDENKRCFYEAVPCDKPGPWVAQHVMPILGVEPIHASELPWRLRDWLMGYDRIHVVADWPEDIKHFCDALIVGPGMRVDTPPLTMEVRRDLDGVMSAQPHNALADALALRQSYLDLVATPKDTHAR